MVKHIVMWKLLDHAEGATKKENAVRLKEKLEALKDKISVIQSIEVGLNFNTTEAAFDVALYSEFQSQQDLQTYQKHPEHVRVAALVNKVRLERAVVDYEI